MRILGALLAVVAVDAQATGGAVDAGAPPTSLQRGGWGEIATEIDASSTGGVGAEACVRDYIAQRAGSTIVHVFSNASGSTPIDDAYTAAMMYLEGGSAADGAEELLLQIGGLRRMRTGCAEPAGWGSYGGYGIGSDIATSRRDLIVLNAKAYRDDALARGTRARAGLPPLAATVTHPWSVVEVPMVWERVFPATLIPFVLRPLSSPVMARHGHTARLLIYTHCAPVCDVERAGTLVVYGGQLANGQMSDEVWTLGAIYNVSVPQSGGDLVITGGVIPVFGGRRRLGEITGNVGIDVLNTSPPPQDTESTGDQFGNRNRKRASG